MELIPKISPPNITYSRFGYIGDNPLYVVGRPKLGSKSASFTFNTFRVQYLDNSDEKAWYEAVFLRENPRGEHTEYWYHQQGCKMWLIVERNTLTHEIKSVSAAHPDYAKQVKSQKTTKRSS